MSKINTVLYYKYPFIYKIVYIKTFSQGNNSHLSDVYLFIYSNFRFNYLTQLHIHTQKINK